MRGKKIVLDLEFIPYRRKQEPYCVHEIIEIGAVALDADNEIYDEFQMYVKPQYGTVPPFVTAITGITNEMLVGQVSFSEAMQAFEAWLPQEDSYRFYTWSGSDQHVFQAEAEWKERPLLGNFYGWWVDLQRLHQRIYGFSKPMKLVTALGSMQIYFEGTEHGALADARNTAKILQELSDVRRVKNNFSTSHVTYNIASDHTSSGFTIGRLPIRKTAHSGKK